MMYQQRKPVKHFNDFNWRSKKKKHRYGSENGHAIMDKLENMEKELQQVEAKQERLIKKLGNVRTKINDNLDEKMEDMEDQLEDAVMDLHKDIKRILKYNLTAPYYKMFLQNTMNLIDTTFGEVAENYLNKEILLITRGGMLNGCIMEYGTDYLIFKEILGSECLVPYKNITSFITKGSV